MTTADASVKLPTRWDLEADVVVVGYGLAGAIAAIEAHDEGGSVVLLEKMPQEGGISRTAGGFVCMATNAEDAFNYLQATCGGRTPDDLLWNLARGLVEVPAHLEKLAKINDATIRTNVRGGSYPLPGWEVLGDCVIGSIPGYDPVKENPHASGFRGGLRMWKVISDNVKARKIDVHLSTPAKRLIADSNRQVLGILADSPQGEIKVKARKAVILTCGGFEADQKMLDQYVEAQPIYNSVFLGNTGDGIRMAQELGAELWHMWVLHGSYGFLHSDPKFKTAIRTFRYPDWHPKKPPRPGSQMPWIIVDKQGKRYMNEYPPYLQDTSYRPMGFYDTTTQSYPRIPSYMILDEEGRKLWPLALMTFNDPENFYEWSDDNLKEVENGILHQANSIEEVARGINVDPQVLLATIDRWNQMCEKDEDPDFGRPSGSLFPLKTPPFIYAPIWPVVSNTHGGPQHDAHQRVLNVWGQPIFRLYAAGELGGVFGHLYQSSGNYGECFVGGRAAAHHAMTLTTWDQNS